MKRWAIFSVVVLLVGGALVLSEARRADAPVGPDAFLFFVADTERELTRLPATFTRLSDQEEIEIGNKLAEHYRSFYSLGGLSENDRKQAQIVAAYVERVGARVAARAERKLPYKFHYVPDLDFINAFALPGGHVFMGAGLMDLMETEDELAAVLGHEIEHIDHYHCAERLQRESTLRKIPLGELLGLPIEIFVAGYSKDQELEADREGARLAVRGSYSPQGAVKVFETFDRLYQEHIRRARTPQEELSRVALQTLEGYFRSHPYPADRAERIRKMMDDEFAGNKTQERKLEVAYYFLTERAGRALDAGHYAQAAGMAARSLAINPDQTKALRVLAEAKFALSDFSAAREAYRELLEKSSSDADTVRSFAVALANKMLGEKHYKEAGALAAQLLELQPNQPDALKTLALAQLELEDFAGARESYLKLRRMYPETAGRLLETVNQWASSAFSQMDYGRAAEFAEYSLELEPNQETLLVLLAQSEFALADFAPAAAAYRKLLELNLPEVNINIARAYADALGGLEASQGGARQFQEFLGRIKQTEPALMTQMRVELAGLALLGGDEGPANSLIAEAESPGGAVPPEFLARLGWWYYRARWYEAAASLLHRMVALRPGDPELQSELAWCGLEARQWDDAVRGFNEWGTSGDRGAPLWKIPEMGRAVAEWRSGRIEDALRDFEAAVKPANSWENPKWVAALYSPVVVKSVAEMRAERERRILASRKK